MGILVIGALMLDTVWRVPRLPAPGETMLAGTKTTCLGGKALNQAVAAKRAGAGVRLVAALGDDATGQNALRVLADEGVDATGCVTLPRCSDETLVLVTPGGENCTISVDKATRSLPPEAAYGALGRAEPGDVLLLQGNLPVALIEGLLDQAAEAGLRTVFNPSPARPGLAPLLGLADVVVVNRVEAEVFSLDAKHPRGSEALVLTLGQHGATLVQRRGETTSVPAPGVKAADSTGAGDALCGTLAAAWEAGFTLDRALKAGVAAASLSVTRHGTFDSLPSAEEVKALWGKV